MWMDIALSSRSRPKKRWVVCVNTYKRMKGVSAEITNDRRGEKKKSPRGCYKGKIMMKKPKKEGSDSGELCLSRAGTTNISNNRSVRSSLLRVVAEDLRLLQELSQHCA